MPGSGDSEESAPEPNCRFRSALLSESVAPLWVLPGLRNMPAHMKVH